MKIAILIIAAGASRRLGQPKQLVPFRDTFLLNHIIQECQNSKVGTIYIILGANAERIEPRLPKDLSIFYHKNWKQGMGTSIAFGMQHIDKKDYEGVIIAVSDQPFFSSFLLKKITQKYIETNSKIIISEYEEGMGTPSFFEKTLFSELLQLKGDIGAKPIIKKYRTEIQGISFPKGNIDIDTPEDLKLLENREAFVAK
ncbi:MAG: nucleotidyltransferase family protein [Saprospiraceae bacterium]